jgi:amino acid efflux transporter
VPRRSIALVTGGSMLSLALAVVLDLGLTPLMLLATGCFTLVYVVGTAAALRLLPRGTRGWWTALVAHASVVVLLVVNGVHALWALGLVVLSLTYQARTRR